MNLLKRLPPFDSKSGNLNVLIDTPKGCRSKFAYDMKRKAYVLKSVLPQGALFPFDFGSIPGTIADDGDPVDALILMDEPAFCGCLIESRLVGVIEAEQSEDGKTERNDRLIAVAAKSQTHVKAQNVTVELRQNHCKPAKCVSTTVFLCIFIAPSFEAFCCY